VKQSAYFRTTFTPQGFGKSEEEYVQQFRAYLDEATQMAPYVTCMIDLAQFEVLPGVYDMAVLDRMMDAAADRGAAITVRLAHVDQTASFRWLPYARQRSYDNTEVYQHYYGCYSPVDAPYLDAWLRANRALYDRYKTHPGFQGYYLMMPGGEWSAVLDKPYMGILAGYDRAMKAAFRQYLQRSNYTLEALNARWGTAFPTWDAVESPLPDFSGGAKPDLRVQWLDFCRFKQYLNVEFWYTTLAGAIREYDAERVIIVYCGEGEVMKGVADFNHGGGVPYMPGTGESEANWWQYHVGAIQEPHHPHRWNAYGDPSTRGWVLDWDLYTMMSIAGAGGTNLHVYYYPDGPLPEHYGVEHAYDRFEKFKPIFRELHSMRLVTPLAKQVATYQDPSTLFTKHRTNFAFRLPDLSRWFELLTYAGVENEPLQRNRLTQYKLVLPNLLDEVMTKDSIDMLSGYVRGGGHLVISAMNGRYCPELGAAPFPLLSRLDITPPVGDYVQQGLNIQAEATQDSPLFAKGEKLKFYTLDNLKNDPNREEIQKNFFRWPFRWIPQTDYFGYYRDNKTTNGTVLARFANGSVAISRHTVEKGEVIVFWGVPEYTPELMKDTMTKLAIWAGVTDPNRDNPIRLMMEGHSNALKRHYAILWQEKPGHYVQKIPDVPDGVWFVDEMLTDQKFGAFTGKELREQGLAIDYYEGYSPLKVLRLLQGKAQWMGKYRMPAK